VNISIPLGLAATETVLAPEAAGVEEGVLGAGALAAGALLDFVVFVLLPQPATAMARTVLSARRVLVMVCSSSSSAVYDDGKRRFLPGAGD
jgi:hypothetical protein